MRVLCLILMFVSCGFALSVDFKNACVPLEQFSTSQKEVLRRSYLAGKSSGLGLTLAAIAWKESCAGVYKMNFQDPSAGNFHAYIPGVINRFPQLKQNGFTQNMVGALLVQNDNFAEEIAISELKFWEREHKGDWKKVVKSYNKGYSWQKDASANALAEKYYQEIAWRVRQLESYFDTSSFVINATNVAMPSKVGNLQPHTSPVNPSSSPKVQNPSIPKKSQKYDYYAYGEDHLQKDSSFLPIYQIGNEFAMPYEPKKTIIKEFELMEVY